MPAAFYPLAMLLFPHLTPFPAGRGQGDGGWGMGTLEFNSQLNFEMADNLMQLTFINSCAVK